MSEEKSVLWLCHRCARKKEIELEPDPVLLKVCDGCSIENWTRPAKAVKGTQAISEEVAESIPNFENLVGKEALEELEAKAAEIDASERKASSEEPSENLTPENDTGEPEKVDYDKMTKAELLKELESRG